MKLTGNNLIIVNILATYARILFVAGLGLFSTRWVLQTLGREDFGLYSVVGGLIVFILFIGNTMAGSVQRFYAYAIGQGDPEEVKRWFNCAFMLHAGFSVALVLVGIPFGNYLLDHVMQIPLERLETCHWVYYLSIIGGVGTMMATPYLGMFYAKQRIFELSLWGALQAALMFSFALYILKVAGDVLLLYAVGMVGIKLILDLVYIVRSFWLFRACRFQRSYCFSIKRSRKLASFAGWSLFGPAGGVLRNQGLALLINFFSGPKINAAFGIANQVAAQTGTITMSMYQAISPEITSREGGGERDRMISLSLRTSKFAVLITLLWLVPLYAEIDYILGLWLGEVPLYSSLFCRIILIAYFVDKLTIGYMGAIHAKGRIAGYQATLGGILILTFPLAWLVYLLGGSPGLAVSMTIFTSAACSIGRIWWVKHLMGVPISRWFKGVFLKIFHVSILVIGIVILFQQHIQVSFFRLFFLCVISCISTAGIAWFVALDINERMFARKKIMAALYKIGFIH
ncbi:MAG: MATE family efflux transporter [Limisphaerales bacterium]